MGNISEEFNDENGRLLRDMNEELLVSSVRQHQLTEIAEKSETNARRNEEQVRETNRILSESLREIEELNRRLGDSSRAAFNLTEDAVQSRETVERLNRELREEIAERLESEKALRESRAALQGFYDSSPLLMGIAEVEGDNVYAAEANEAVAKHFSMSARELSGMPADRMAPAEVTELWLKHYKRSREEKRPVSFEYRFGDPGEPKWLWATVAYLGETEGGRSRFSFFAENVTERRRSDEALRESDERLRIATEAAELGTWVWELDTGKVHWNRRHFEMLGIEPQDGPMTPSEFFEWVHPDDRDRIGERLNKAIESGKSFEADFRIVRSDGRVRWMSGYGRITRRDLSRPTEMSGVMLDITHRMEMEEDLRESHERLRLLIESATEVSIFTMDKDGIINSWNTGSQRIFGWEEEEIVGRSVEVLFTPEDLERGDPEAELLIATEQGRALDERWHLRKDGTQFFASGLVQPLGDGGGEGFVKIARDMTERLKAERDKREKEVIQSLVEAQEAERKRIARDLHDELGQRLTALRLKLDNVGKGLPKELEDGMAEVKAIAKSIDDGVDFLAWELRPAALDDLGLVPAITKFVAEWTNYSSVPAYVNANGVADRRFEPAVETALYRIVQEGLNNVHKHSRAKNAEVSLQMRGGYLVLIVDDDGVGFDPEDNAVQQRGMGLVGIEERAQIIGGTFELESEPGHGTTLYVKTPVRE